MTGYEYKVVPAPTRPLKAKGVKGTSARFANALETVMNDLGTDGWEYQRTDTLPVEERQGLTGKTTTFQNMLVFRRRLAMAPAAEVTALIEDRSKADDLSAPPQVAAAPTDDPDEDTAKSADARVEATLTSQPTPVPFANGATPSRRTDDALPAAE
ncbi:DUF4177 domain-containing protein [Pseudooctadecabacter sp.]|uniref:DUF4177 domain-containing protein n=1 Tax=Pseudooctadecabacter sp. TaxID=1966338 RepID=UPI0025E9EB4E|nr:DUF4177 domain-containing protein [Pseudooctadecabacter sp.]